MLEILWHSQLFSEGSLPMQYAWKRDTDVKMRERASRQNILTRAGIWGGPAMCQRGRGGPAAPGASYFIWERRPTMAATFATLPRPRLSADSEGELLPPPESPASLQAKSEELSPRS